MEGQCRILQDRVEAIAFDGRRVDAQERVGGEHDEEQEGEADRALYRHHAGAQFKRQVLTEERHGSTVESEDQHPEQHRAFVVSPYAADLVEQRLGRMRIRDDVLAPRSRRRCRRG